jgi:lambda family phage minor tail protein L
MTIQSHVQKLDLGRQVTLFELDVTSIGGSEHFYFCPSTDANSNPVVWQGITYQPFAIEVKGFETSTKGTLPRPTMSIGNVNNIISVLLRQYDDLIGAKIIRRRTFDIFLDGAPGADPSQHLPDDVFFIERKISESVDGVEIEMTSAMDLEGMQLPSRTIVANSCQWEYRSAECSYVATNYFDVLNQPVGTLSLDVCNKLVGGCKVRFGATKRLPFGGFPAARIFKNG